MKRIILLTVLLFAGCLWAGAQDVITTRKGEDIKAKVVEVGIDEVKYIKADNPDGPTYIIRRGDLLMIRYANGDKDIFYEEKPEVEELEEGETISVFYKEKGYKELRQLYCPRDYYRQPGDPYSPASAGVASLFLPGLGQCIDGEFGRGLGVFVGNMALMTTLAVASSVTYAYGDYYYDAQGVSYYKEYESPALTTIGIAYVGFYIWNIIDAVRIAKVKNLYHQDMNRKHTSLDFKVEPYLNFSPAAHMAGTQPVGGLSLKVNF
ncbi:MAG: hypothetical protein J6X89_06775 [Bacteroidales bacterium]|nr:hypothetical protein [Bacteroidales bacterium]